MQNGKCRMQDLDLTPDLTPERDATGRAPSPDLTPDRDAMGRAPSPQGEGEDLTPPAPLSF